jgi:hypothetical protein
MRAMGSAIGRPVASPRQEERRDADITGVMFKNSALDGFFRLSDDTDNPRSCQVEAVTAPRTVIT